MELKELEYGMILETRNHKKYILHNCNDFCFNLSGEGSLEIDEFDKKLKSQVDSRYDIVKIYEDYTCQKVLWQRKEILLSSDEKALLRCLPKEIKWIARDEEGELWCFETKPFKASSDYADYWDYKPNTSEAYELNVFKHLFQFVKWEDDEPTSIEELLEAGD